MAWSCRKTPASGDSARALERLSPPEDAVFDREVKCVRRGSGFKSGNTVLPHYAVVFPAVEGARVKTPC
jgi:hypothetical protein